MLVFSFCRPSAQFSPYASPLVEGLIDMNNSYTLNNIGRTSTLFLPINQGTNPYETFSFNDTTQTLTLINTSSNGLALIPIGDVLQGEILNFKFTVTLNSGTMPTMRFTSSTSASTSPGFIGNNITPVNGYNDISIPVTTSNTGISYIQFLNNNTTSNLTIQFHSLYKNNRWAVSVPDSRNNGLVFEQMRITGGAIQDFYNSTNNELFSDQAAGGGLQASFDEDVFLFTVFELRAASEGTARAWRDTASTIYLNQIQNTTQFGPKTGTYTLEWRSGGDIDYQVGSMVGIQTAVLSKASIPIVYIGANSGTKLRAAIKIVIALKTTATQEEVLAVRRYLINRYNL
jgi:hypothetical protein